MSAIDRVMRVYASRYDLNLNQAALVREELSKFIEELTARPRRAAVRVGDVAGDEGSFGS